MKNWRKRCRRKVLTGRGWNLFDSMRLLQVMQKLDGSGWKMSKIPVIEIFGPTIQGEGSVIGQKTMFVRTAGCDYRCKWCDSAFTWDGSEKPEMMEPVDVVDRLFQVGGAEFNHVTISGGNPALIGKPMGVLIDLLHSWRIRVGLETQGSRWQDWLNKVDDLVISPKPPSSGMETDFDILTGILNRLTRGHSLK